MKEILQWIKNIGLFLFGIVLIVWGYKTNAANNAKLKKEEPPAQKAPASPFGSVKQEKPAQGSVGNQPANGTTVIETDKKAEESSGTK